MSWMKVKTCIILAMLCGQSMGSSITPQDMKDLVFQGLEDTEESKKHCKNNEYWSYVVKECKSCDRDCPNGTNLLRCGNECRTYFNLKKQAGEIDEVKLNQNETERKYENILQEQAEEIEKLKLNQIETERKYENILQGQAREIKGLEEIQNGMLEQRNLIIAGFAVLLLIILAIVAGRYYLSKKKKTASRQTSDKEEVTPTNSNGNLNGQVNIAMTTTVVSGAATEQNNEAATSINTDNKQDEIVSSTKVIAEEPATFNNAEPTHTEKYQVEQSESLSLTVREQTNTNNKATGFYEWGIQPDNARETMPEVEDTENTPLNLEGVVSGSAETLKADDHFGGEQTTPLIPKNKPNPLYLNQTANVVANAEGDKAVNILLIQQQKSGN